MISDRIKLIRNTIRYKQKDIAKEIGVGKGYLSDLERGIKTPSKLLIKAYCKTYNVNEEWLVNGTGNMFKSKAQPDIVSKLKVLSDLKQRNDITEAEYNLLKANLLKPLQTEVVETQ